MRKLTGALLITGLLAASSTAGAATLGARFSTTVQYHGFSLRAARAVTARYEHHEANIGRCDWMDRRHASCRISQHPSKHIVIGWIDVITRLGHCTNHGVNMGVHCFTGPLKVQTIDRQEWYRP